VIPVEQRHPFDCMTAALASLFEVAYDDVPHFCSPTTAAKIVEHDWWAAYEAWLRVRGFVVLQRVRVEGDGEPEWCPWAFPTFWIAGVESPRTGGDHAIVMHGNRIAWDPHPRRAEHTNHRFVSADYFLPIDPARLVLR
jgi:hypothetical protein